ncbi:MAG: nitroreductase family protein [Janthinobacterium lividum]
MSENARHPTHPIDPLFIERWSPRAFGPEAIPEADLLTLFEAAHWAPSAYNSQPWRFIYARRESASWPTLLGLLNEFNQSWAKNAAALVFVLSNSVMRPPGSANDVPARSHSFDAGAAWGFLALQATRLGWYTHGMTGVDFDRAFGELGVPAGFRVEAAVAIGRLGDKSQLPEMLQGREAPSMRQPLAELVFEGRFGA